MTSILSAGRDHYLSHYRSAIKHFRARNQQSAPELMLERNRSTAPIPYRYLRVDIISGAASAPKLTEINVDPHETFAAGTFAWGTDLRVTLHPFVWNGIEFVSGIEPNDFTLLTDWVSRWLNVGDTKPHDEDGLSEVIHSVTYPAVKDARWSFSIDFGSAPVAAFEELMDTLPKLGVTAVSVGSFTYLNPQT